MTIGIEKLLELKAEAEKYDGCLTAWSKALGYKNYQAFHCLFEAKRFSDRQLNALLKGAETIRAFREREKNAIEQVNQILIT
jgi:hypothetical protein